MVRGMRPDPDRLPNDHFIEWLAEAKQLYHHELPPFAKKNQGSTRAGLRKPVTLQVTDDQPQGQYMGAEVIIGLGVPNTPSALLILEAEDSS